MAETVNVIETAVRCVCKSACLMCRLKEQRE